VYIKLLVVCPGKAGRIFVNETDSAKLFAPAHLGLVKFTPDAVL